MTAKSILAAIALCGTLAATPASSADILKACGPDISQYCSAVDAGNGRLISCLYAHELVISDECDAAMGDIADILDTMFASLRTVYEQCSSDIFKLCGEVAPGEGRIFSCLINHRAELSDGCTAIMSTVRMPGQN